MAKTRQKKKITIIPITQIIDNENEAKEIGLKFTDYKRDCFMTMQNLNGTNYMFHLIRLNNDKWYAISILKQSFDSFNESTGTFDETWSDITIDEILKTLPIQLTLQF